MDCEAVLEPTESAHDPAQSELRSHVLYRQLSANTMHGSMWRKRGCVETIEIHDMQNTKHVVAPIFSRLRAGWHQDRQFFSEID